MTESLRAAGFLCVGLALGCASPPAATDAGPIEAGPLPRRPRGPRIRASAVASEPLFATNVLHDVEIELTSEDLERLGVEVERVPCTFVFDGEVVGRAGIRLKGGLGSAQSLSEKPGFSLKFDTFVPGQRFHTLRKLLLNNLQQDEGWVSEHLAYEMYRRAGIAAPRSSYARVTVNGELYGVYLVREAINNDFLRIWFGSAKGNLYEGECCGEIGIGQTTLKNHREARGDHGDLEALAGAIDLAPDEGLADALEEVLDVDQFLRVWAVDAAIHHWDGYAGNRNNFYLYDRPADGRFVFIPHGVDQAFQDTPAQIRRTPLGLLPFRMFATPELEDRWEQQVRVVIGDEIWDTPAFLARVDEAVSVFGAALEEDPRKSHDTSHVLNFADYVREHLRTRPAIVRAMLDATCGNRRIEPPEECDDGNVATSDGCNAVCQPERCGDDVIQRAEACDGYPCAGDCRGPARCGDGYPEEWEACEDGDPRSGDGCSAACVVEVCGDGLVQAELGERCDGARCRVDCTGAGRCGDGVRDLGEDCDDGNVDPDDGCAPTCGDGDCAPAWIDELGAVVVCEAPRDFAEATARCASLGAALAVPRNAAEHAALAREAGDALRWVGVDARTTPGTWRDPTGAEPAVAPWASDHPTTEHGHLCVAMDPEHDGAWIDLPCTEEAAAVCRIQP